MNLIRLDPDQVFFFSRVGSRSTPSGFSRVRSGSTLSGFSRVRSGSTLSGFSRVGSGSTLSGFSRVRSGSTLSGLTTLYVPGEEIHKPTVKKNLVPNLNLSGNRFFL